MNFPNLEKYRGFIFDLDGTLIDSMPHHIRAWIAVGAEHGFKVNPDDIYAWGGISSLDVVDRLKKQGCNAGDPDAFVARKVALYREHINEVKLFQNVFSIMKGAHERGCKCAIASGTQRKNAIDTIAIHDLKAYVDALVTAEDVRKHKPDPETFLKAANQLELPPEECVVFEDGRLGIEAAIAGGFDCVEVKNDTFVHMYMAQKH